MRLMLRADNPGGRARSITVLQNQGLIVDGLPVDGLRVDEIGVIMIAPPVMNGSVVVTPAVIDDAYHANLWIVEPLFSQIKEALQPGDDEDEKNSLFDALKASGTHIIATVINSIKRPEGYTTANNVSFYLPRWVATPRRVWC